MLCESNSKDILEEMEMKIEENENPLNFIPIREESCVENFM